MALIEKEAYSQNADAGLFFVCPARAKALANTDELLALARDRAIDPRVFDDNPPFFFQAEISSTRLDSYFTHMDAATTLPNFARDASAGVSFMNSHRTGGWGRTAEMAFGRSLIGRFSETQAKTPIGRVEADFYTIGGLNLNGVETDHLIKAIRSGIASDVSVGFLPGKMICDLCGLDMLRDWDCPHYPGFEYEVDADEVRMALLFERAFALGLISEDRAKSKKTHKESVICTAMIVNGRLIEVSAVYDGATPGAMILKAQRLIEAGALSRVQVELLEMRYRIHLGERSRSFSIPGSGDAKQRQKEKSRMADSEDRALEELNEELARLTAERARTASILTELGFDAAEALKKNRLPELVREVAEEAVSLRPLAADGRSYREQLVQETLDAGVRAMGAEFRREIYEAHLKAASLEAIRTMKADWDRIGDGKFTPGGRKTEDKGAASGSEESGNSRLPAGAFRSGVRS